MGGEGRRGSWAATGRAGGRRKGRRGVLRRVRERFQSEAVLAAMAAAAGAAAAAVGAKRRPEAARVGEEGRRGSWAAAGRAEERRKSRRGVLRRGRERFRGEAVPAAMAAATGAAAAAVGARWRPEAAVREAAEHVWGRRVGFQRPGWFRRFRRFRYVTRIWREARRDRLHRLHLHPMLAGHIEHPRIES